MMTRFVLTLLVGLVVSLGTTAAFAETFACKRYTDDSFGFTTYSVFESYFPKSISLDIYDWKSRSGYKALTKEENNKKYRLLPNGKMIAGLKPKPGFKTVDNVRYKCDRTSLQLTAGLERKSADTQLASTFAGISDSRICIRATNSGKWEVRDYYKRYVQEAKRRGLTCGVHEAYPIPKKEQKFIAALTDEVICRAATFRKGKVQWKKSMNGLFPARPYVFEAKRRGLSCGVGETTSSARTTPSSNSDFSKSSASYSSNDGLCNMATRDGNWETGDFYTSYVQEAKRRGLSCGVGETSSSTQTASAPKAKPKVTSAALTAAEKEAERLRQELAAEKKADEEARKKAAELAAMIKEDEEEEARKAAELVAKKKKEEALLKFKIEKQKEGAEDFYASVIEYVRSSEKVDILKWTDQYEKAPKSENQWNEKASKAYDDFYNWAFSDIDFKTFFKNRADVLQRDRLDKIQNLISKLSAQITDLRKIAKQQFGLSNADSDVTNLISKITTVLSNKDKPNELNLPGLAELSFSAQKLIESHKASETRKKRLVASLNKLRAKLQEFARNDFGSAAAKEAVAIVKKIDDALTLSTTGKTELDNLKTEAGKFLEEVEENKNKSSTKTENRKNEKSDQNKDRSATKFDAFQNYAVWDSSTDTQKDAFKEKWVGRYVEVTGPIADVDKMKFSDRHWVILDTSFAEAFQGNAMFNIRAMTGLSKTEARKLVVGQEITVRGTVKRIMLGVIILKDAKILSSPSTGRSSDSQSSRRLAANWTCNVPQIAFNSVTGRRIFLRVEFKNNGKVSYKLSDAAGTSISYASEDASYSGDIFKLSTSRLATYEVNGRSGVFKVYFQSQLIETSYCQG